MPQLKVQSILALSSGLPEREMPAREFKKPTDTKIKSLVLQQIVQALQGKSGALFPSATAPKVVVGLLSSLQIPKKARQERVRQIQSKPRFLRYPPKPPGVKKMPVGLARCEPHNWINSLLQMFLFLPGCWDLCSLIPRSFQPLREFADQYFADQAENLTVSSADSAEVVRCLIRKLPPSFFQKKPPLYDILTAFMGTLFSRCPFDLPGEIHPVFLHPECHLAADAPDFEKRLEEMLPKSPPALLIEAKKGAPSLKSHYVSRTDGAFYDLDAFIELRPDGDHQEHYIAYLKYGGTWYQCDDDRVAPFRSNCLNAPLRRAALLHYKRVDILSLSQ